jgi:hypothetical protein
MCIRLKRSCTDFKETPLIGNGFKAFIDNLFLYLPFSSKTQADEMRERMEMSDDIWVAKREELKLKHLLKRAPKDLRVGWKAWLAENGAGTGHGAGGAAVAAAGVTSRVRD